MELSAQELAQIVARLATRPRHETVRTLLWRLLVAGLGAPAEHVRFEAPVGEVRGRIDALLGCTLFEIKSDLRREGRAAEAQLARYLAEREAAEGAAEGADAARYVGVATDGASFVAYELRGSVLAELGRTLARPSEPRALLAWLEGVVAVGERIRPDALAIATELGRESPAFARSLARLGAAWDALAGDPEAQLKRQLWERHLAHVYGRTVDDRRLWLQHTYLVVVAKAIAAGVMRPGQTPPPPHALLSGSVFTEAGVTGAVEEDLFSWILDAPEGPDLVARLSEHVFRFDLGDVDVDLLKVLYEALIDPAQRHDLGEYYTPDWLAHRVVREALRDPARERVLDPSCGSGSFLFHAIRAKTAALNEAGVPAAEIARRACEAVYGIDVHPVAVIFARVTVLLALGRALRQREGRISVPVYLGDALQWNVRRDLDGADLVVDVPPDPRAAHPGGGEDTGDTRQSLRFPLALCARPEPFEQALAAMQKAAEDGRAEDFRRFLERSDIDAALHATLERTCRVLLQLCRARRDHVWTFVARNLSRPVALSDGARVDVIVGNPPWLSYRFMARDMQKRFAASARAAGVFVGPDEAQFLRPVYLGSSIAPYRVLGPSEGIVPVLPDGDLLDARQARARGLGELAAWLDRCEGLWKRHGNGRTRFTRNLDHFKKLTAQFPIRPLRVMFAGSGSRPAAALVQDPDGVVEHALYWAPVASPAEGRYLLAVLNSETARARVAHLQARGEQGARHFDKLVFTLPVPPFDPRDPLHEALAALAQRAEAVAGAVEIAPDTPFVRARGTIRAALAADGVAGAIDTAVARLLDTAPARAVEQEEEEEATQA